jgi:hypothetical protein
MADDPYRDELEAAHQRIAALEAELTEARSDGSPPEVSAPELEDHLLPGELVLWVGGPHPRRSVIRPRHVWFMGSWAFFLFWMVVGMMRGMPPAFSVPAGSFLLLMRTVTALKGAQALRDARGTRLAITNRRVLLLKQTDGEVTVRALPLEAGTSTALTLRGGGLGDLIITPPAGEAVRLAFVPDAANANRLLGASLEHPRALPRGDSEPV